MAVQVEYGASLRLLNTFGVEARASHLVRIRRADDLAEVAERPDLAGLPRHVLGAGSNVLLTGDLEALVLKIEIPGRRELEPSEAHWRIDVGAGENWHSTVADLVGAGRPGLENLALIPGLMGAAPIQNIGAYGLEIAERLESVVVWDEVDRRIRTIAAADCDFGYRDSAFKRIWAGLRIIVGVTLALPRRWQAVAGYADVVQELRQAGGAESTPSAQAIFDAVVAIRSRKLPDPTAVGNAGSFFKNPVVSREKQAELLARFPSLVSYQLPGGRSKLAAGWLIEAAGLKGATRGRAGVYEKQALVLVNRGNASGHEILALAREVQDKVREKFGLLLEPEPVIL